MDEDDEEVIRPARSTRSRGGNALKGFIVSDDEENGPKLQKRQRTKSKSKSKPATPKRPTRRTRSQRDDEDDVYVADDVDADGSYEEDENDVVQTTPEPPEDKEEEQEHGRGYSFRKRNPDIDYTIPPLIGDQLPTAPPKPKGRDRPKNKPRWGVNGTELSRMMGVPLPDSDTDSDIPARTPRKAPFGGSGNIGGGMFANGSAAGVMPEFGVGTPSNLGKVGEACKYLVPHACPFAHFS